MGLKLHSLASGVLLIGVGTGCQLIGGFEDHQLGGAASGGSDGAGGSTGGTGTDGTTGAGASGVKGGGGAGGTGLAGGGGAGGAVPGVCGDGKLNGGEQCDDGDDDDFDGCTNGCKIECSGQDGFLSDPNTGHCYMVFPKPMNQTDARTTCQSVFQGDLVSITSQQENDFVSLFVSLTKFTPEAWIGAVRTGEEDDDFMWLDGDPWGFEAWDTGEPEPMECVLLMTNDSDWRTDFCLKATYPVCERHPGIP